MIPTAFVFLPFMTSVSAGLSDLIKIESGRDEVFKAKHPILAERDGRFIRFDKKDTEIELELGVSVPFLKIPLYTGFGSSIPGVPEEDKRVTVNAAGVLVGVTLLISSFLLVPLVLPSDKWHDKFNLGRSAEKRKDLFSDVQQLLRRFQLDPNGCSQKALCEIVHGIKEATGPISFIIDNALRSESVTRAFGNVSELEPVRAGELGACDTTYSTCFLTRRHLELLPRLVGYTTS